MTTGQANMKLVEGQRSGPRPTDAHIEFKPLPMMALRSSPGEVLDEVSREGAAYLIERNGQQKACLGSHIVLSARYPAIAGDGGTRQTQGLR